MADRETYESMRGSNMVVGGICMMSLRGGGDIGVRTDGVEDHGPIDAWDVCIGNLLDAEQMKWDRMEVLYMVVFGVNSVRVTTRN